MHATAVPALPRPAHLASPRPLVIGHRGAPAYRPEHTRASFELAIELGADLIEPDVLVSRDGALVVRHESALSLTTDVARRPEFAARRRPGPLDGRPVLDWFVEDFDLAELRTLSAVERMPGLRPVSTAYDGRFGILTLAEVVELARAGSAAGRPVRVLAELKSVDAPMSELVTDELRRLEATDGSVVLQSFDAAVLRDLRHRLGDDGPRMVQLVEPDPDGEVMLTPVGLREISTYAQGVAPSRDRLLPVGPDGSVTGDRALVDEAHRAALSVFVWTLRAENAFLPAQLRRGEEPSAHGDAMAEARMLLDLGVDGLITDSPDHAVAAVAELLAAV